MKSPPYVLRKCTQAGNFGGTPMVYVLPCFAWVGVIEAHGQCKTLPRSGGGMSSPDEINAE
jgi:hypothetical protein